MDKKNTEKIMIDKRNCIKDCVSSINCSLYTPGSTEREICERTLSSCIQYKCAYSPFKDRIWFYKNIIENDGYTDTK